MGRRDTEILINDSSISKKHATLSVKNDKLTSTDLTSNYGTFLNQKTPLSLTPGDIVKFGIFQSIFKVDKLEFVTTATKLNNKQKSDLRKVLAYINDRIINDWDDSYTHVTAVEFSLTVKILHAILDGRKIVTFNFWKELIKHIKQHLPPPNEVDFAPQNHLV